MSAKKEAKSSQAGAATSEGIASEVSYSKAKLLGMSKYRSRRDLLGVLLKDGQAYTLKEVDGLMKNFMKGKVK